MHKSSAFSLNHSIISCLSNSICSTGNPAFCLYTIKKPLFSLNSLMLCPCSSKLVVSHSISAGTTDLSSR